MATIELDKAMKDRHSKWRSELNTKIRKLDGRIASSFADIDRLTAEKAVLVAQVDAMSNIPEPAQEE